MPPPLYDHLISFLIARQQDPDHPMKHPMSGLTSGVIIGISVGAAVLVLIILAIILYCYCHSSSRTHTSDAVYYKFDYNSSSLASIHSQPDTMRNTHTPSTSAKTSRAPSSRAPSSIYFADDFSEQFDNHHLPKPRSTRTTSKNSNRNRSARTNSSYASMDDAISAPRTLESEVPSSKVAFLDDHGRPITTPL